MKPFLIQFEKVNYPFQENELLIEYRKVFKNYEYAMEWALLTASTHNVFKNEEFEIIIKEITHRQIIKYNGQK